MIDTDADANETKDPTAALADLLIDVVKNRERVVSSVLESLAKCQTMLDGLPKIVEAMSPDEEAMRLVLGADIKKLREEGAPEDLIKFVKDSGDRVIDRILMVTKSIRAIAKTQITLARHTQNMSMLMLIYVSSDGFAGDASKLAMKLGKGNEAIRALWQSKFGKAF